MLICLYVYIHILDPKRGLKPPPTLLDIPTFRINAWSPRAKAQTLHDLRTKAPNLRVEANDLRVKAHDLKAKAPNLRAELNLRAEAYDLRAEAHDLRTKASNLKA